VYCEEHQHAAEIDDQCVDTLLKLRYLGTSPIAVRGTITRSLYHFSDLLTVQTVDVRDARFLLASRLFGMVQ
jgi:hypothetical protein